jgi:acyl-CoA hydrolase/GNAT superfamily N-acetyltransferase
MKENIYWADNYITKRRTAKEAIDTIRPGQRVFIGSACGEPQILVKALASVANKKTGLEVIRMMSQETTSLSDIANQTHDLNISIRNIYLGGSSGSDFLARNMRFTTPMNISEVPTLFTRRKMPINVALIQVTPPDDFGWMSLGISVDITLAAAHSADCVIAQVNTHMPRVLGSSFIHVNDVNLIVEHDEELLSARPPRTYKEATLIGKNIARLIEDGATLQVGLDAASQATIQSLSNKNDLGFHSLYLTDDIMHLYSQGIITNRMKGINTGKLVASAAIGSDNLYEFLNDNPAVDFRPSDYVNDPFIISQHNRMVSMNVAHKVDLTGQVYTEASPHTLFAGISGIPDFVRGAKRSIGGKSILMLSSTSRDGKNSNIVPFLRDEVVVVPRADVHYVATEYGVVNLFSKSIQERAIAMITIAHPDFREELLFKAKKAGFVDSGRKLGQSGQGIYPVEREEMVVIKGEKITIRPAKPVDERRIQEHYYSLDKKDIMSRFFHEKSTFGRSEVEGKFQIDYIKDMTFVGVVGEAGFDRVIAVSEYLLLYEDNMAEVAFSVHKEYQRMGLGKIFIRKLAQAARDNGISGLMAYTYLSNKAMINLFKTLPYKTTTSYSGETLMLKCRFDQLKDDPTLEN